MHATRISGDFMLNLAGGRVMRSVRAPLRAWAKMRAACAPMRVARVELSVPRGRGPSPRGGFLAAGRGRGRRQVGAPPEHANAPDRRHDGCYHSAVAWGGG
jgi:hypothetical protein